MGLMVEEEGTSQMSMRKRERVVAVTGKNIVMCECPSPEGRKESFAKGEGD